MRPLTPILERRMRNSLMTKNTLSRAYNQGMKRSVGSFRNDGTSLEGETQRKNSRRFFRGKLWDRREPKKSTWRLIMTRKNGLGSMCDKLGETRGSFGFRRPTNNKLVDFEFFYRR